MSSELFDRVVLEEDGSRKVIISSEEFFSLPLSRRIRHIIERTITFQLRGKTVDAKVVLAELRRRRAI